MQVFKFTGLLPQKGTYEQKLEMSKEIRWWGANQKPFTVGNIFWNNAISGLSSWCQVNRGFKLLCMLGVQTKQRSFNNGKVNIYMHWFSGNIHLSTFHLCNSYDVLILTRKWSQCTEFVLFVIWKWAILHSSSAPKYHSWPETVWGVRKIIAGQC